MAAARLLDVEPWKSATAIKVNPDSPQRPLRAEALRRGITVFVPTPRLRGGFKKLDPRRIPPDKIEEAASLSRGDRWSEEVALTDMPRLDAIVCGSVAVTRDGRRCGKGEGYSDLEFAILRELGHPPVPVATTVHDLQVVDSVPRDPTDQPLSVIATPTGQSASNDPTPQRWASNGRVSAPRTSREMPILADLKKISTVIPRKRTGLIAAIVGWAVALALTGCSQLVAPGSQAPVIDSLTATSISSPQTDGQVPVSGASLSSRDVVRAGGFPRSFLIPGTETSIRIGGS